MTRDEVIALAREAGFLPEANPVMPHLLERFAALVAAHEREKCAKICEDIHFEYERNVVLATWCADAIRRRT